MAACVASTSFPNLQVRLAIQPGGAPMLC
jgi:hypothetical protein